MESDFPRISVIVPCYNAERYVDVAIRSILQQDWPNLEVIVVDDGSTDGSADVVRAFDSRVRLLSQKNAGVASARNAGIASASGDWIAFLDADDVWLPGKLRAQWSSLRAESAAGARMSYTAWAVWVSSEPVPDSEDIERLTGAEQNAWDGPSGWIYPELLADCVVWTSTVLVHRSVLREVGGFETALRIGEDYDLWLRASRVTPILRVSRPFALYRMHPVNLTRSIPPENYKGRVVANAVRRWGYASPDGRCATRSAVRRGLSRSWGDFAGTQLKARMPGRARSAATRAIFLDPRQSLGWVVLGKSLLESAKSVFQRA